MSTQLHAKNILELGALHGESTTALLLGAFVTGGRVHSVDLRSFGLPAARINVRNRNSAPTSLARCPAEGRPTYIGMACRVVA